MKYLISILPFLILQGQIFACNCNYATEVSKAYEESHTIVYGEIVDLQIVKVSESMNKDSLEKLMVKDLSKFQAEILNSDFLIEVKIKKKEILKGSIDQDIITLHTTRTDASCGFTRFKIGKEYIVYSSPNSFFFSIFNSPQDRKLKKRNTFWVTSCSITDEFEKEHFLELLGIRNGKTVERILKSAYKILRNEDLLKDKPQISTTVFCEACDEEGSSIGFQDEEINTDIIISSLDLLLRIIKIEETRADIRFKSYDDGGSEHSGSIQLILIEGQWKKESLNYVTAIE